VVQSLDRGLRILDEIAAGRTTLGSIADSLGVHKSTVLRLLATLQRHHFVQREDASHYRLGRRLYDLASFASDSRDAVGAADGPMRALAQHSGRAVYLAVLEGVEAVVALKHGPGGEPEPAQVGAPLPLPQTAAGQVLLAGLSSAEQALHLAAVHVDQRADVEAALADAAASGFAVATDPDDASVRHVATEVRGSGARTVAALAVTGPSADLDEATVARLLPQLFETAAEISKELGGDEH